MASAEKRGCQTDPVCIDGEKSDRWYQREIDVLEVGIACGNDQRNSTNVS